MEKQDANLPITADPERLGGTPVFRGTRVPVATLFEYLEDNYTLYEFLDSFPSVSKEDALAVLVGAQERTLANVSL
jgi:uncharacterized protein (DUF433 family)